MANSPNSSTNSSTITGRFYALSEDEREKQKGYREESKFEALEYFKNFTRHQISDQIIEDFLDSLNQQRIESDPRIVRQKIRDFVEANNQPQPNRRSRAYREGVEMIADMLFHNENYYRRL